MIETIPSVQPTELLNTVNYGFIDFGNTYI